MVKITKVCILINNSGLGDPTEFNVSKVSVKEICRPKFSRNANGYARGTPTLKVLRYLREENEENDRRNAFLDRRRV